MIQPLGWAGFPSGNGGEAAPRALTHKHSQLFHPNPQTRSALANVFSTCCSPRRNIPSGLPSPPGMSISVYFGCLEQTRVRGGVARVGFLRILSPDLLCLIWAANGFWCQRLTTVWSTQPSLLNLDGGKSPVSPNKV